MNIGTNKTKERGEEKKRRRKGVGNFSCAKLSVCNSRVGLHGGYKVRLVKKRWVVVLIEEAAARGFGYISLLWKVIRLQHWVGFHRSFTFVSKWYRCKVH